ncbi:hypothetical protein LCGC14_1182900, partial [marine sediment metagenome]
VTYGEWLMSHDVYRAAFTFEIEDTWDIPTGSDKIIVSLFNDVSVELTTPANDIYSTGIYTVEFYYDFNTKELTASFDDADVALVNNGGQHNKVNYNFYRPKPSIETEYTDPTKGIKLLEIESQYFKRVTDNRDFEEYKSLLSYYKFIQGHVDEVNLDSTEVASNPINQFTYLSAEIDVMYSFNDNLKPENIETFGMNFNPTFDPTVSDNLLDPDVALQYYEDEFVISPYDTGLDRTGTSTPQIGDFIFEMPENPNYVPNDPLTAWPGAYGDVGTFGGMQDVGGGYTVINPGYDWHGDSDTLSTFPTGVIGNDEFWQSGGTLLNAVQGGTPDYIYSYQSYGGQGTYSSGVMRPEGPSTDTEQWTILGSGSPPHAQWLDEVWDSDYNGRIEGSEANTDGAYIATDVLGYKDKWDFTNPILSNSIVSQIKVYAYTDNKHCPIEVIADFNDGGDPFIRTLAPDAAGYGWKSFTISNLAKGQVAINTFELMVEKKAPAPEDMDYWLEVLRVDAVYIEYWIKMLAAPDAAVDFAAYGFPAYHQYRVEAITVQVLARSTGVGNGILDVYRYLNGWSGAISSYVAYGGAGAYTWYTFTFGEWSNYIIDPSDLRVYLHWYSGSSESLVIDTVNIICTYTPLLKYQRFEIKLDIPSAAALIDHLDYRFSQTCPDLTIPKLVELQIYSDGAYVPIASNALDNNGWIGGSQSLDYYNIKNDDEIWVKFYSTSYEDSSNSNDFKLYLDQLLMTYYLGDRQIYNSAPVDVGSDWGRSFEPTEVRERPRNDDSYFGRNTYQFTMGDSLITPVFGRDSAIAYADIDLIDVDFDFNLYPDEAWSIATNAFPLEHQDIEGKGDTQYIPSVLRDYSEYSTSRFRNSAIDDIQIPLITPIELDFGTDLDPEDYNDLDLEIALDLDIALNNRLIDSSWSQRFRLLIYNYYTNSWEDFDGLLRAENEGINRPVWDPVTTSDNFIDYLQNPEKNNFIPIYNNNDISIKNPILIDNVNVNTLR